MKTKPDYFYTQSGVIPYRFEGEVVQVLLITSRRGRRWVIPKGVVELDLSPAASAAQEALEEAGIEGRVHPAPMGSYTRQKWGGTCTVTVFLMEVETIFEDWAESFRQRVWMTVEEAIACVEEEALKGLIRRVPAMLAS